MRIILHPGFHKTGTSSLQAYLTANRAALAAHVRIVLLDELKEPLRFATHFSIGQDPFDLAGFTASFAQHCEGWAAEAAQTLVISCEGLSGRTPGKRGIMDYAAAAPLASSMERAIKAVFGGKVDLTYLYTTREPDAWLSSAWRHNLMGYRVTEDFETFCALYGRSADFAAIIDQIRGVLRRAKLVVTPLETVSAAPAGPAEAILHLLDLPQGLRAGLHNPGLRNAGITAGQAAQLLAINRSDVTDADAKRLKASVIGLRC